MNRFSAFHHTVELLGNPLTIAVAGGSIEPVRIDLCA
jgi:hypothetical protein